MAERRRQRYEAQTEYKNLYSELRSRNNDDVLKTQKLIQKHLEATEKLYPVVKKRPASASFDSRQIREIATLGSNTAKRLAVSQREFDFAQYVCKIKNKIRSESSLSQIGYHMFLRILGEKVDPFMRRTPVFRFMFGPLQNQHISPIKRQVHRAPRRFNEKETVSLNARNVDEQLATQPDDTSKEVEQMYTKIKQKIRSLDQRSSTTESSSRPKMSFVEALVDKQSFCKTVENLFHSAFLVHRNKIGIVASNDGACVSIIEAEDQRQEDKVQTILSFTYNDYVRWNQIQQKVNQSSRPPQPPTPTLRDTQNQRSSQSESQINTTNTRTRSQSQTLDTVPIKRERR